MPIFGKRKSIITKKRTSFYCLKCKEERVNLNREVNECFEVLFIPFFVKNISSHSECETCHTIYKGLTFKTKFEFEDYNFDLIQRNIQHHLDLSSIFIRKEDLKEDSDYKALVFELGVIECLLSNESQEFFFDFLERHCSFKYNDKIFDFLIDVIKKEAFLKERELGFRSLSDSVLPNGEKKKGHTPSIYLKKALGLL